MCFLSKWLTACFVCVWQGGEGDDEAELSIFCVTCGQEINQRGAIKHMEKCFAKVCN